VVAVDGRLLRKCFGLAFGVGLRLLVERARQVVLANLPGVRADLDAEFLHDLRVALRRARVVLELGQGVFDDATRSGLVDELRWLGHVSGPCRDLDVLLADLRSAPGAGAALAPLVATLVAERDEARARLLDVLAGERAGALLNGLAELAEPAHLADHEDREDQEDGGGAQGLAALAGAAIRDQQRALLRRGRASTDDAAWHEVRKAGKRLRYLIEAVRSLVGEDTTTEALGALRALQDVLGEGQDAARQAELLHGAALRLACSGEPLDARAAEAVIAGGASMEQRYQRRRVALDAAATAFEAYDAKRTRRRVRRVWEELLAAPDRSPSAPRPSLHGRDDQVPAGMGPPSPLQHRPDDQVPADVGPLSPPVDRPELVPGAAGCTAAPARSESDEARP
jgi:CHAD domain-containing protein